MGAIKALQRRATCHPADLQRKTLRTSHSYLSESSCPASEDFPLRGSALSLIVHAKEPMTDKMLSDQLNMQIKVGIIHSTLKRTINYVKLK